MTAHMTYHRGNGALSGIIGGTSLHIVTRPTHGSATLPVGHYTIQPPVVDPVYGMVAMVVPATGASKPAALSFVKDSPSYIKDSPSYLKFSPSYIKDSPSYIKDSPSAPQFKSIGAPGDATQVFVLSQKAIPGRNCIIISHGFADLMDALGASGGATVTVG